MQFGSDGKFAAYSGGLLVDKGTFSTSGNEITWETSMACYPQEKAAYTWTYQNATLVFKVKGADPCADRQHHIDGISYQLHQ